jgi:hypothetical protein
VLRRTRRYEWQQVGVLGRHGRQRAGKRVHLVAGCFT